MNLSDLPMIMIKCLVCTIAIEIIMSIILGIRNKKDLLNITLVNCVTNPLVVSLPFLFLIWKGYYYYRISFYVLELLTLVFEGYIYYKVLKYKRINPFLVSLILNLSSYFIGELINML